MRDGGLEDDAAEPALDRQRLEPGGPSRVGAEARGCLPLDAGEVHVWRASLEQEELLGRFTLSLAPDERERATRFRSDLHRARFVAGRAIQRDILARYTGVAPDELAFSHSRHGKPQLVGAANAGDLSFNVSNSGGLGVYAVCRGRPLGVDVEEIRPVRGAGVIAERFFSPRDLQILSSLPSAERQRAFFECWVRTEAYVKALGESVWSRLNPVETESWEVQELELGHQYAGALVVRRGEPLRLRCLDWKTPIDSA